MSRVLKQKTVKTDVLFLINNGINIREKERNHLASIERHKDYV